MLPSLTIQHLDYLVAVTEFPTWAAAAADRGVSPSALSQGLAELERRLGIPLFERDGRRRVPSRHTGEVVAYARRVLADTRDLGRWLDDLETGTAGELRLGMIDAALGHWPDVLPRIRAEHPDVDLHLTIGPSATLLDQVAANELDLAVVVAPRELSASFEWVPLMDDPLAVYAPADTTVGPPPTWGPWVTFPPTSHTRRLIDRALAHRGAPTTVTSESNQPEVLKEMVHLGLGWTVLPIVQAETGPQPLQRATPEPLLTRSLLAARRSTRYRHPLTDSLIDWLTTGVSDRGDAE
mgnify:CR=1 FL=1